MDKSYESYEYMNTGDNENNQFFVVQNDGTFLNINRQIQYVTQVQDAKELLENVEPCTVYDVSSQQFFIDVDNSAELISVSDQFILPEGENNVFANNYLLPVPNSTEQLEAQDTVNSYQGSEAQAEAEVESQSQSQIDCCTEITLSDEQYHTLEQKGWILLETNEKVFVLDTLGLHDITSNNRLIQKLKQDGQRSNENAELENNTSLSNQQDTIQFVIGEDGIKLAEEIVQDHGTLLGNIYQAKSSETTNETKQVPHKETVVPSSLNEGLSNSTTDNNTFKVMTDIVFKEIPEKILLGKTEDGKKLFAKITKLDGGKAKRDMENQRKNNLKHIQKGKQKSSANIKNVQESQLHNAGLNESQFETLIRLAMQNSAEVKCTAEDVASADSIVTQLLKVPAFKPSVLDRNLIITKEVSVQGEIGVLRNGGLPTLVTGRVTSLDDDRSYFVHLPGMLQRLMSSADDYLPPLKRGASPSGSIGLEDTNVLHVHVTEIKRADNVLRVSITLNKRKLPNTSVTTDNKRASLVFGCSACAAVFQTENELKEHQETQCVDVDDVLTIDVDKNVKGYTMEKKGKDKCYSCNQCQLKFTKLYNCLKHLKTHFNSVSEINDKNSSKSESNEEQKDGIYKCMMCSSTYFHPSTLSKHIVAKHIKVRQN
ncbi:unnamed protein product, partial [Iphiclides podalirius]